MGWSFDSGNRPLPDKARKPLAEAEAILAIDLYEAAGRAAYLAGFHAAQAFISERTGRSVKTHKGVHGELYRLTKNDPDFTADLRAFLSRTYNLKTVADYEIGPDAQISPEQARAALEHARRFVAYFTTKLAAPA
jgi:uncharacterized protein (UPF0332 family)